mmetsp:Transcript_35115/g.111797  ORF Transcript_35115/g.111797 Transcript_35115/m.111797 type:complete len:291 (+) Transcript_35115:220-1092(+)
MRDTCWVVPPSRARLQSQRRRDGGRRSRRLKHASSPRFISRRLPLPRPPLQLPRRYLVRLRGLLPLGSIRGVRRPSPPPSRAPRPPRRRLQLRSPKPHPPLRPRRRWPPWLFALRPAPPPLPPWPPPKPAPPPPREGKLKPRLARRGSLLPPVPRVLPPSATGFPQPPRARGATRRRVGIGWRRCGRRGCSRRRKRRRSVRGWRRINATARSAPRPPVSAGATPLATTLRRPQPPRHSSLRYLWRPRPAPGRRPRHLPLDRRSQPPKCACGARTGRCCAASSPPMPRCAW